MSNYTSQTTTAEVVVDVQQAQWQREAEARWGNTAAWNESRMRTGQLDAAAIDRIKTRWGLLLDTMAGHLRGQRHVTDTEVQATAAAWVDHLRQFYTPDAELVVALADGYVDDPQFRANFEAVAVGLPEYVRDALSVYAIEVMVAEH